jgi:Alpha amylase, catalytic domain
MAQHQLETPQRRGDAILLGEANVVPKETLNYFGKGGERIQMMFNFFVNQHLFYALATADIAPLVAAVDPRHGSSGDFVEFMQHAKKRGIEVIMDLVVNHSSDQHRWFQESRTDKHSQYHDWYVWSKKRPANWKTGMVFPGVQKSTWTYDKEAREYYFHRFYEFQPDLNMHNPAVRTEIRRIMGYWLELGAVEV